jgi:hypothetical protein
MRGNGAQSNDPNARYDDSADDDYDLLDDLADDELRRANARQRAQQRELSPTLWQARTPAQPQKREGAFNALLWLLDGATGAVEELRHNDLGLSEDFWVHAAAARKETLMALRAVLNDWIDEENESPHRRPKPIHPNVAAASILIFEAERVIRHLSRSVRQTGKSSTDCDARFLSYFLCLVRFRVGRLHRWGR